MRRALKMAAVLTVAAVILWASNGCGGGGGGGGGGTVVELGGSWFGPFGTTTMAGMPAMPAGGTAGMMVAPATTSSGGWSGGTGGLLGITGTIVFENVLLGPRTIRVYSFTTDAGDGNVEGLLLQDGDRLLYIDENLRIGAFQRNAGMLAPAYSLADVLASAWTGYVTGLDAMGNPAGGEFFNGAIDAMGLFAFNDTVMTMSPVAMPLAAVDPVNGQFGGPFMSTPGMGNILFLMTPDKQFLAGFNCWGAPPENCRLSVWTKN